MSTQTETHRFTGLALMLTGNVVATRLSGEVEWKVRDRSGSWQLERIFHIFLRCEGDALVELLRDEPLWPAVEEALHKEVKTLNHRQTRGEFSKDTQTTANPLDSAAPEAAA